MSESQNVKRQETETTDVVMRPPVDIHEDETAITLYADLPGVASDRLNIQVDDRTLTIAGVVALALPESMEALHAEVRSKHYERSFTLSRELDTDKIDASLKEGVLSLFIPKREEVRPRSIEVKVN